MKKRPPPKPTVAITLDDLHALHDAIAAELRRRAAIKEEQLRVGAWKGVGEPRIRRAG